VRRAVIAGRGSAGGSIGRVAAALVALGSLPGCSREPTGRARPNVLVVLVDALRADHLGAYGYARATSPHIDALASEGVLFERAFAQSPWTKPSIPTLFTSLYPIQHGVYEGETPGSAGFLESDVLAHELTTIAEVFRAAGYRTAAFVNNAHLLPGQGFAQGFDLYDQGDLDAAEINRRFLAWLDGEQGPPFLAYLHYLDAHWPFRPEPAFAARFAPAGPYDGVFAQESWRGLRDRINRGRVTLTDRDREELVARHDGAVAQVDAAVGELLAALRGRGALDTTLLLLTSDHGEELLDHGRVGHGGTLYDEVLHVPLLIRPPGGAEASRIAEPVRLLDVLPTLAAAAGVPAPAGLEGRDLLGPRGGEPELVAETRHKHTYRAAVRVGGWKYVRTWHATGPGASAPARAGRFGLAPGMRLKAKGSFAADGALAAEKVTVKDAGDDDVELAERIAGRDGEALRIGPFRAVADDDLDPEHAARFAALEIGTWVKVEGGIETPGTLVCDKVELLAEGDRETELEGLVESVALVSGDEARLAIAGVPVLVGADTRIQGGAPGSTGSSAARPESVVPSPSAASPSAAGGGAAPEAASEAADADPFAPARLLSAQGLEVEEELYDLASDPRETLDLAAQAPAERDRLRARLEAWIERMAAAGGGRRASRGALDDATVDELRELGYLE
jgi:arylsulfatase A-like enzyme